MVQILKLSASVLLLAACSWAQLPNLPDGTTASGQIVRTNIAAPSTPASGKTATYTDSTSKVYCAKNDAGTISCTVIADTGASHNFLTAISAGGVISKAQPSYADLSGASAATPSFASTGVAGANGSSETFGSITESVTLNTGATTTDSTTDLLPANSIIDAVTYRITTTITTSANFTLGDGTIAARFCSTQSTLTAGTTGICFVQADQTGTSGPRQVAAAKLRITLNANPGAGVVEYVVFYHTWVAPTS